MTTKISVVINGDPKTFLTDFIKGFNLQCNYNAKLNPHFMFLRLAKPIFFLFNYINQTKLRISQPETNVIDYYSLFRFLVQIYNYTIQKLTWSQ